VRWVVCGGEDWRNPLAEQCKLIMPWADVYNGYGPTEASIAVTIWKYDGRHGYRKPPIGGPITNVHFLVVGPDGRPVSIGETGELWIGGMAVSPGYVNQERFPELWRKFVAVRLTPSGEQMRFFRTGDLVTVLDRDVLEFVGRVDNQVKVRGTRLELEEIEAVVEQVPGVEKAIALVENRDELGLLKIFYVTKENAAATAEDAESTKKRILDHCARSLPPQGVPQRIDRVDSIPLGLNGKVDRRRFVAETPT
jgi:acyl-CoA synthetase (AMP-forming)/AMP-acid ligase II